MLWRTRCFRRGNVCLVGCNIIYMSSRNVSRLKTPSGRNKDTLNPGCSYAVSQGELKLTGHICMFIFSFPISKGILNGIVLLIDIHVYLMYLSRFKKLRLVNSFISLKYVCWSGIVVYSCPYYNKGFEKIERNPNYIKYIPQLLRA